MYAVADPAVDRVGDAKTTGAGSSAVPRGGISCSRNAATSSSTSTGQIYVYLFPTILIGKSFQ
jgi:hypothetical protein